MLNVAIVLMMAASVSGHTSPDTFNYSASLGGASVAGENAGHAAVMYETDRFFTTAGVFPGQTEYAAAGITFSNVYFGAAAISDRQGISGTHGQFYSGGDIRLSDRLFLSVRHLSNCAQICGWASEPNEGLDTVSLTYKF